MKVEPANRNGSDVEAEAADQVGKSLTPQEASALYWKTMTDLTRIIEQFSALGANMLEPVALPAPPPPVVEDEAPANVEEAARLTGLSKDYLYKHKELPFRMQLTATKVGFSRAGIRKWMRARTGR